MLDTKTLKLLFLFFFVMMMWLFYIVHLFLNFPLSIVSIHPRSVEGLVGILTSTFFHYDFTHIMGNTIPLFIFLFILLVFNEEHFFSVIIFIILFGNIFTWIFGHNSFHLGSSGLIYGLFSFNLVFGILTKRFLHTTINVMVIVVYMTSIMSGLFPNERFVSYTSHWFGFLSGVFIAIYEVRRQRSYGLIG